MGGEAGRAQQGNRGQCSRDGECVSRARDATPLFFSSSGRHTRFDCDWSSDVCSSDLPRLDAISLDARSLVFAFVATMGAAALFSVAPLLRVAHTRLATRLRGSRGASAGAGQHRTQNALVIGQVALALVLLVSSGLMVRTFEALRSVEPG